MKPAPFRYFAANSVDDAIAALSRPDAKLLAGGQSLVPMMNFRLVRPAWLIDINRVAELKGIHLRDGRVLIGSMTRYVELENSDLLKQHSPLISETVPLIGHSAIRNRGTIGGSVSHADPAADLPVALLALDAVMHVRSARGTRAIASEDFFVSLFTTALESDEVLTGIEVQVAGPTQGWAFEEFARRHGDFALASVAVRLCVNAGRIEGPVRIAIGAAVDHAVRAHQAEAIVQGAEPSDGLFEAAADEAAREIEPVADIHGSAEYRRDLVRGLAKTALGQATKRAVRRADPTLERSGIS
jgi:carbon-monoxide dehydrogenase medium subunit